MTRDARGGRIFIDVTKLAHTDGPLPGSARVEFKLARELLNIERDRVRLTCWVSGSNAYADVHRLALCRDALRVIRVTPVDINATRFRPDDTLLVIGSAWTSNDRYRDCLIKTAQEGGVRLVACVFDVIPWRLQALYPGAVVERFSRNCEAVLRSAAVVLTTSRSSARDIADFCRSTGIESKPIRPFTLGDDPPLPSDSALPPSVRTPFALCVSTMDRRKNHRLLLRVWERLSTALGDATPGLVFLGGAGLEGASLREEIDRSDRLRDLVSVIEGADDAMRDAFYRDSLFTLYPSLLEGWGMPVAESLLRRKFCLAADAGSLPEVAPGLVELIDPTDADAWLAAVQRYVTSEADLQAKSAATEGYRSRDWSASARDVIGILSR